MTLDPDTSREAAAEAGLRWSTDAKPGIARRRAGRGFSYRAADGSTIRDSAVIARIRALADPAGLDRRLDLPRPARPPPGDRPRRPGPQAVPLPRALARASRRREVRPHDRVRRAPADDPRTGRRRPRPPGPAPREGAGRRRPAARADADPGRQRGVRPAQQVVRPHDAARPARADRRVDDPVPVHAARAASRTRSRSATAGWRGSSRAARSCPARSSSSTWTTTARCATSAPRTSTRTCARRRAARLHRQGLPHLGRHGAGVPGAARAPAERDGSRGAPERRRGDPPDVGGPGQHAGRRPQELRPSGRARRRTSTAASATRSWRPPRTRTRRRPSRRRTRRPASSTCCGSGSSSTQRDRRVARRAAGAAREGRAPRHERRHGRRRPDVRGDARAPGGRHRHPAHRAVRGDRVDRVRVVGVA